MPEPCPAGPAAPSGAPAAVPPHHAEFRAAFNAAVAALYQRSTLPVSEIARAAGVTERAIYDLARRQGWQPRRPAMRRRGAGLGPRRDVGAGARLDPDGIADHLSALCAAAAELDRHVLTRRANLIRRAATIEARRQARETRQRRRAAERERLANFRTLQYLALTLRELTRMKREHQARQERADPRAAWFKRARRDKRRHAWQPGLVSPLPPRREPTDGSGPGVG